MNSKTPKVGISEIAVSIPEWFIGVEKIADALQKEYASDQVAFTLVNPGSVDTEFVTNWKNREAADF